ncbi:MAG: hypothetical protein ACK5F8_17875, partial [Bradyrhizobium sp.]
MIEAVIWDFGGVLTTSPFEAFARYETERGLPVDIIRRTNAANHLDNAWAKFERAEIGIDAFDALFATESKALGAEVRGTNRPMPNATADGITMINFGMGSANAATVMDLLSAVSPKSVLLLGKCGGLKRKN